MKARARLQQLETRLGERTRRRWKPIEAMTHAELWDVIRLALPVGHLLKDKPLADVTDAELELLD